MSFTDIDPPKAVPKNRLWRAWLLGRACANRRARTAILEKCQHDTIWWINSFVWQYNPNAIDSGLSAEVGPFITWDFQDQAIRKAEECIRDRRDLVVEKSREMGASWLLLLLADQHLLFVPRKKMLVISKDADSVDRPGDADSLFWKLDFVNEHLPDWMANDHIERRKMGFECHRSKSAITGQASTGKAGVGGRAWFMIVDEFSQISEDYEVFHRTSDTTGCRIFNGTHKGLETCFYELTNPDSPVGAYIQKLRMHWSEHPDKIHGLYQYVLDPTPHIEFIDKSYTHTTGYTFIQDGKLRSPWYDNQCARKADPRAVAMDLDINPSGSVSQFFDAQMIATLKREYCRHPLWEGDVKCSSEGKLEDMIRRPGGPLKIWCNMLNDGYPPVDGYGAGADVSGGAGSTPSCLSIVSKTTGEKVLEYANAHILPDQFATLSIALCRHFKDHDGVGATIAWECHGPGSTFTRMIRELGYVSQAYRRERLDNRFGQIGDTLGWSPTGNTKFDLLNEYRSALMNRMFINRSEKALHECLAFVYTAKGTVVHSLEESKKDPSGARVNHGDRVIADALACKMVGKITLKRIKVDKRVPVGSLQWRRMLDEEKRRMQEELVL